MKDEPVNRKSGPQIFRAREAGEVREVQFVIERRCPHNAKEAYPAKFDQALPFPVWVRFPPEIREDPEFGCVETSIVYRLSAVGIRQLRRRFGVTANTKTPCVCEHMGQVIE